ncbi:hypothetical protein [Candidatus Paracaedibacter symbiosus]|uniref:hypothetical protein n=1 Tax=Candidatus Paracaedibacter symbiosus TaxID=244582 RepID=UPI001E53BB8A|nr:hypothetical protein [Candidatus Paracaedibacter symbiosus]
MMLRMWVSAVLDAIDKKAAIALAVLPWTRQAMISISLGVKFIPFIFSRNSELISSENFFLFREVFMLYNCLKLFSQATPKL